MAHIGFTPQSEHALGGFRVQGRGAGAEQLLADAHAVQDAGAFAVVMEMVPAEIAGQVTKELAIPTIGIGAGVDCDAQVLVWPDMAGLTGGRVPKFVKKYADLRAELLRAAREYADDVRGGAFPGPEHSFDEQGPPAPTARTLGAGPAGGHRGAIPCRAAGGRTLPRHARPGPRHSPARSRPAARPARPGAAGRRRRGGGRHRRGPRWPPSLIRWRSSTSPPACG